MSYYSNKYKQYGGDMHSDYVEFAPSLVGLVIGKRGVTIKALQCVSGIRSISVDSDSVPARATITGSNAAVSEVKERILALIALAPIFSILVVEEATSTNDHLTFCPITATVHCEEQKFFVMNKIESQTDDEEDFGLMRRMDLSPSQNHAYSYLDSRKILEDLSSKLGELDSFDKSNVKHKFTVHLGKILFRRDVIQRIPVYQLPSLIRSSQFSNHLSSDTMRVNNLRKVLGDLGFIHVQTKKGVAIHLVDVTTGKKSNLQLNNPKENSHEDTLAADEHVIRVFQSKNYFQVLQINEKSAVNAVDVKKAYRKLSLLVHPDKNSNNHAKRAFQVVSDAYQALSTASGVGMHFRLSQASEFPPLFTKEELEQVLSTTHSLLPSVRKYIQEPKREGFMYYFTPKPQNFDMRVAIRSEINEPVDKPFLQALSQAWDQHESNLGDNSHQFIQVGASEKKQIHLIRYKETESWVNENVVVKIVKVSVAVHGWDPEGGRIVRREDFVF
ncbi:hypothetical protein BDR26DRAFT_975842 [Obelidium mucronatum]|nr:hypothetical protein BDR26DRAFT_975842 [Obelidium mucronatum]